MLRIPDRQQFCLNKRIQALVDNRIGQFRLRLFHKCLQKSADGGIAIDLRTVRHHTVSAKPSDKRRSAFVQEGC
jgi:hypothetical protein